MVTGWVVVTFMTVLLPVAFVAFSGLSAVLIGHGLFINGPVDEPADLVDEVDPGELPVNPRASDRPSAGGDS